MQIVKKEQKLQYLKNQLAIANDPIEAQVAGAYAKNNDNTSGNELYISLSQELLMPKTKSALKKSAHSLTNASTLLAQRTTKSRKTSQLHNCNLLQHMP